MGCSCWCDQAATTGERHTQGYTVPGRRETRGRKIVEQQRCRTGLILSEHCKKKKKKISISYLEKERWLVFVCCHEAGNIFSSVNSLSSSFTFYQHKWSNVKPTDREPVDQSWCENHRVWFSALNVCGFSCYGSLMSV